jgi:type IV pilus secretin PilQ/predicted competence protein
VVSDESTGRALPPAAAPIPLAEPPGADQGPRGEPIPPPLPDLLPLGPASAAAKPDRPQPPDPTAPISLHVDDMDVRKALEILSRQGNLNILVSPAVSARVTLDLRGVTVDEALRALLRSCHLAAKREQGIIYVYAPAEEHQADTLDLPIRVYSLNYVRAADLIKMLKPLLSKQGVVVATPQSELGIKTDTEKAGGDSMAGGEAVVVQDQQRVLDRLDRVVAQIDVQPVQILIEAILLTVKVENDKSLGVNYGLLNRAQGGMLGLVGDGSLINAAAGFTPASVLAAGGKLADGNQSGFAADSSGLKFGFVTKNVTAFVQALQTLGDTRVLAAPRILVLNKQRADLELVDRLAYRTITQTQTSTVEQVQFMNVGTQLRVRPFVTSDGIIRMEIHPEESEGALDSTGLPQTSSAEVTTNVMVPDGTTIVIGGLMHNTSDVEEQGIPGLMHLPWIGWLFRTRSTTTQKRELVVILTPHIWQPRPPGPLARGDLPCGLAPRQDIICHVNGPLDSAGPPPGLNQ